jgi:hypothetical protein
MTEKEKPGGAGGTGTGSEIDTRHYPDEPAARQRARLVAYLRRTGSASTLDARGMLGIMHPAGRVHELRAAGWPIVTVWDKSADATGSVHRITRYVLRREVQA